MTADFSELRVKMVDGQVRTTDVTSLPLLEAMLGVPREAFVPESRKALAACIATSRTELTEAQVARITQPTLVAVGTRDDIGGSPDELAGLMPNAESFAIEGRDHMLAVGDKSFKARVIKFLREHPIHGS